MSLETKQLHALSRIYKEAVYGGAKKEAPKDTRLTVTNADKKANTKAYQNYKAGNKAYNCLLYTSPSPRDRQKSRMPSSA